MGLAGLPGRLPGPAPGQQLARGHAGAGRHEPERPASLVCPLPRHRNTDPVLAVDQPVGLWRVAQPPPGRPVVGAAGRPDPGPTAAGAHRHALHAGPAPAHRRRLAAGQTPRPGTQSVAAARLVPAARGPAHPARRAARHLPQRPLRHPRLRLCPAHHHPAGPHRRAADAGRAAGHRCGAAHYPFRPFRRATPAGFQIMGPALGQLPPPHPGQPHLARINPHLLRLVPAPGAGPDRQLHRLVRRRYHHRQRPRKPGAVGLVLVPAGGMAGRGRHLPPAVAGQPAHRGHPGHRPLLCPALPVAHPKQPAPDLCHAPLRAGRYALLRLCRGLFCRLVVAPGSQMAPAGARPNPPPPGYCRPGRPVAGRLRLVSPRLHQPGRLPHPGAGPGRPEQPARPGGGADIQRPGRSQPGGCVGHTAALPAWPDRAYAAQPGRDQRHRPGQHPAAMAARRPHGILDRRPGLSRPPAVGLQQPDRAHPRPLPGDALRPQTHRH